jgi:DNA-binding helix-hairpin-helix protein with protein kinase domain
MKTGDVILLDGKKAHLAGAIASGGEGQVFAIKERPDLVAKVYHAKIASTRERKVLKLLNPAFDSLASVAAKPSFRITSTNAQFIGFAMPMVLDHRPIFELFAPGARRMKFPSADYRFLVRAAKNLARAFAQVHACGAVVGDVNSNGVLVSQDARVTLIDVDSFQLDQTDPSLWCAVGVPEYTPPRLHKLGNLNTARSADDDLFGLAAMIFQLLFIGRHPFSGAYVHGEKALPDSIAENRYVYGRSGRSEMIRPGGMELVENAPSFLLDAFEAAFELGTSRPSASNWVEVLGRFESLLVQCRQSNRHFFSNAGMSCPWCSLSARGADIFPLALADIESQLGQLSSADDAAALDSLWNALAKHPSEGLLDALPNVAVTVAAPSKEAKAAKPSVPKNRIVSFVAFVAAGALLAFVPSLWLVSGGLAIYGLVSWRETAPNAAPFITNYLDAERRWVAEIEKWRMAIGLNRLVDLKSELLELQRNILDAEGDFRIRLQEFERSQNARARDDFLSRFLIRNANITQLNSGNIVALESYGIVSAADVSKARVLQVSGIGEVKSTALMNWRSDVEKRFRPSQQVSSMDQVALAQLKLAHATSLQKDIKSAAERGREFLSLNATIASKVSYPSRGVEEAKQAVEQAKADLQFLGATIPTTAPPSKLRPKAPPPRRAPPSKQHQTARTQKPTTSSRPKGAPSCPACGKQMIQKVAKRGRYKGKPFWGCSQYPRCTSIVNI